MRPIARLQTFMKRLSPVKNPSSASVAKERLQIIISHERSQSPQLDLSKLRQELIEVIGRHIEINKDDVKVEFDKKGKQAVLALNISLRT